MSADILGTSWDQCRSSVQYIFMSTETRRLIRTDSPGQPLRLSHSSWTMARRGIWYFAFLLKLNDRRSAGFLAFIRPVVQWSFAPNLSPWNARFSLLLVLGKYSYATGQQPSWRVPPYFRQISHASPLLMRENLSERGLISALSRPGFVVVESDDHRISVHCEERAAMDSMVSGSCQHDWKVFLSFLSP